jgi:cytochrome P460
MRPAHAVDCEVSVGGSHDKTSVVGDRDHCGGGGRPGRHRPCGTGQVHLAGAQRAAFSDFRGYENWEDVAVSATETGIKVIVANPAMMAAYREGLPAAGKQFPDGSKVAKIEWTVKRSGESPYFVLVPDTLKSVSFIEKDTKRFPDTHGWAYAQFGYDAASDTFTPHGNDAKCGYECHSTVSAKDYIFTAYPKR